MFPNARDSLRRWRSESVDINTTTIKTPIPVAVVLHNFIQLRNNDKPTTRSTEDDKNNEDERQEQQQPEDAPSPSNQETSPESNQKSNWRFHAEHTIYLLPLLHLEISVTPKGDDDDSDDKELHQEHPISVYSQTLLRRSVYPTWEHLDQCIQMPPAVKQAAADDAAAVPSSTSSTTNLWNHHDLYKSMRLKLFLVEEDKEEGQEFTDSAPSSFSEEQPVMTADKKKKSSPKKLVDFLQAPLHPSLLRRMDVFGKNSSDDDHDNGGSSNNTDDTDDHDNSFRDLPPLPPNTLLVHYSDGSVRCLPHVHQLLLRERDKISLKTSSQLHHHEVEDFSRFEDDVFKTLDHVTPQQRRERTASSLLDQELEADELHRQKEDNKQGTMKDAESTQQQDPVGWLEQEMKQKLQLRETIQASAYPYTEKEAEELDLKAQNEALHLQIEEEERLLEEEMRYFREEQAYLASLVQELQELESETALIEAELQSQSVGLQQDELLKQAQSIKLVRDLQVVYPITLDSAASSASSMTLALIGGAATNRATAGGYLIRGLRLPVDIYTTTVPEEEINASLGYCAHLVFMIAKYLTIQLRHRIFCNSSRSAIQQDGVGVFPLFLGRMVARSLEREQVDRGARLLGANVNCILMHLNMPDSLQQVHILARLQAILSFVATGDLPGNMMQPAGSSGTVAVAGQ